MVNRKMKELGTVRSVIRELFEFGKQQKALVGEENVFDFSLGNPNVPAPESVQETIAELLREEPPASLHGYTSAQGDQEVRAAIAADINQRYGTDFSAGQFYMTCGAAASLKIILTALCTEGDEFVAITPFFPEYRVFVETAGATFVAASSDPDTFQPDLPRLFEAVNAHTKAVIFNSPNNPSGVVYTEASIRAVTGLLEERSRKYGHPIYLITDEPYRELVYDGIEVPFLTKYYKNTIVCYSYSKSLSLPGERIGYILVPKQAEDSADIYAAVCGAGRALGYVCAPSLMQRVVAKCTGQVADIGIYQKNRDLLYENLTAFGYHCIHPDGAFYLFVKALESDANAFSDAAKEFGLLLVPGDSFGAPGYVRVSYCVQTEMIQRALPAFRALAEQYSKNITNRK